MRPAAPGPQLSAGRIRVDAGRAIAKLREYQLADRTAWILEAIRAAVASHATRIELAGDANDIWLSWEGPAWAPALLPRLFDELVSPAPATENQHVRLLAAAINSALGMNPAYIDVLAIGETGATTVRYTPDVLVEEGELREVEAREVPVPEGATPGIRVHLRRRVGLDVLAYFVYDPPELALARNACRDLPVPLHVGDVVCSRANDDDILQVPLGEGLDGFIAVTERNKLGRALFEVAERGVVLATYELDLLGGGGGALPLRVYIDAPRMPTNASRSQVRRDAHPIESAERRAAELVPEVVAQLAKRDDERARRAQLALVATKIAGVAWHTTVRELGEPLRQLARLPLARNAVGEPRALLEPWRDEIHTGDKPFDAALAPWLGKVLWVPPGDPAACLIEPLAIDARATRRLARWARRQLRAERKFYSHRKRDARVENMEQPRMRMRIAARPPTTCVPDAFFEGIDGEVCVYPTGKLGSLTVLLHGRELECIEFDSPLAFDVVLDTKRATPGDRYRGIKRDAHYRRLEAAMRGAVVRALECLAVRGREQLPTGVELGPEPGGDVDAALFRAAFGVVNELGLVLGEPLTSARAYRAIDGRLHTLGELATQRAIGVVPADVRVDTPEGRIVLTLDDTERAALDKLVGARIVPYRHSRTPASILAHRLAASCGGALEIRDGDVTGAIAPAEESTLWLCHMGVELHATKYEHKLVPCTIVVDSDAIVPDRKWTKIVDDAGVTKRAFVGWEIELVRAIARALFGERPATLLGSDLTLAGPLGSALCAALRNAADPRELLGNELAVKLYAQPLFPLSGKPRKYSLDELAAMFAESIPYLPVDYAAVADFAPLVAGKPLATLVGTLTGRTTYDATDELVWRRQRELGRTRLEAFRRQQPVKIELPRVLAQVPLRGDRCSGLVGISGAGFSIHVYVEGRPFTVLRPPQPFPLIAVVEIAAEQCGESFESVPDDVAQRLTSDVVHATPQLLIAVAKERPTELREPGGPVRALFASYLRSYPLSENVREALCAARAFQTLQRTHASITDAVRANGDLFVASWQSEWIAAAAGEADDDLDAPILVLGDAELPQLIETLHRGPVLDVSERVRLLQSRRAMARGLVPKPTLLSIPSERKRPLSDFPAYAQKLGLGEVGLIEDGEAVIYLHERGQFLRNSTVVGVRPPVALAIEDPRADVSPAYLQGLAVELVTALVPQLSVDRLSPSLRKQLARAVLGKSIAPEQLGDLPLFQTTTGNWMPFSKLQWQRLHFGDVWAVSQASFREPLNPQRLVFLLDPIDLALGKDGELAIIDAERELAYDALARQNLARPKATSLEVRPSADILAQVTLDGDGNSAPRGVVAVLDPRAADRRGLYAHSRLFPYDRASDACRWPTIAIVDDARLTPNRTWSAPVHDETYQALGKAVRDASEAALATIGEAPEDALVSIRINNHSSADVPALRRAPKSLIRGVMWLEPSPREFGVTRVRHHSSERTFIPSQIRGLAGNVIIFSPDGLEIDAALEQLCIAIHGKLVRSLTRDARRNADDAVTAHVAHALAIHTVRMNEVRGIKFTCFSPRALDARAATTLLRGADPVTVILPDALPDPDPEVIELVDNGSLTARTIIAELGDRVRRSRPQRRLARSMPRFDVTDLDASSPPPPPRPAVRTASPPPHKLAALVEVLRTRVQELGIGSYNWHIIRDDKPMFTYDGDVLVAGDNPRLLALAAAIRDEKPWVHAAIDVVVAHAVTVLNRALAQVTDASEAHALGLLLGNPPPL